MSNPRVAAPALATCLLVLASLSSCTEAPPGNAASALPRLVVRAPSVESEGRADASAPLAYFEAACAACHDEGPRACLVPEGFQQGRLGPRFDEIPAHRGVSVPERMRRALRLCVRTE